MWKTYEEIGILRLQKYLGDFVVPDGQKNEGMQHAEEWQKIEDGLDIIGKLSEQIAIILSYRNTEHPVEEAIKLTDPDLVKITGIIADTRLTVDFLKENLNADTIQIYVLESMEVRFHILKDLVQAMEALNQDAVNALVQQLEWI